MSTPNTHAPGSPEWLRKLADSTDEMGRGLAEAFGEPVPDSCGEEAAGLRAAAERIEQLEGECATWRDAYHALRVAHSKEITENGVLHAELLKNDRLRAENEALKNALGQVYLALGTDESDHAKWPEQITALRADKERLNWINRRRPPLDRWCDMFFTSWRRTRTGYKDIRAAIDAAREET